MRCILGSNSKNYQQGYLDHLEASIRAVFEEKRKVIAFIPYASKDVDAYAKFASDRFAQMGHDLKSIHLHNNPKKFLDSVDGIFVGGGNTFRLLKRLYDEELIDAIRSCVEDGAVYIGTSAGANIATPNIRTTNDMPIVYPPSFEALKLVPFNINPHYIDTNVNSVHMGETREQRIQEFIEENPNSVVGLREGGLLIRSDDQLQLTGNTARIFYPDGSKKECVIGEDLSFLLTP